MLDEARADQSAHDRFKELSLREITVLEMLATGLTNAQMAERLELTVHAVKFHLASVYHKLGVANRTEAAVLYLRHGGRD
jgi:DNA-binding NarL/FixJ family response regulator